MFAPANLEVAMVSFEGPDQYAQAGGLGVRAREMCRGFAAMGFRTSLYFVGDPQKPEEEVEAGVRLVRCIGDVSRHYPAGVYEGEAAKMAALEQSLPLQLVEQVVRPASEAGRLVAILFEEWQTARLCQLVHAELLAAGLRHSAVILWNANNHFGFDGIDWPALSRAAAITTVSRYMKHLMWPHHVNPVVVANGIPQSALVPPDPAAVEAIRQAAGTPCLAFKIGRFSGDKRWHQALDAIAALRSDGMPARLVMRGGIEAFGSEVLAHADRLGLTPVEWREPVPDAAGIARALQANDAAVINVRSFLPDAVIPEISAAATAVLANSGHEPFGLVGLEAMAAGAVAVVGDTGEEYARPYGNAIVIESDQGAELASALAGLVERPALAQRLRLAGRHDAEEFLWSKVLDGLLERLRFLCVLQQVPPPPMPATARPTVVSPGR